MCVDSAHRLVFDGCVCDGQAGQESKAVIASIVEGDKMNNVGLCYSVL